MFKGTSISKNFEIDDEVIDVFTIYDKARLGECVYITRMKKLLPAAFVLSMQTRTVVTYMSRREIFTVKRKK